VYQRCTSRSVMTETTEAELAALVEEDTFLRGVHSELLGKIAARRKLVEEGEDSGEGPIPAETLLTDDAFWAAEVEKRLGEHADEIFVRKLLLEERELRIQESADLHSADEVYAREIHELENEFELCTRRRLEEEDRTMAKALQAEMDREEGEEEAGVEMPKPPPSPVKTKRKKTARLALLHKLVDRIRRKNAK
jgi:hypothetical protein